MYCRRCDYNLTGLATGPCPECGRAFDPARATTWTTVDGQRRRRHVRIGLLASCGIVVLAGLTGRLLGGVTFTSYHGAIGAHLAAGSCLAIGGAIIAGRLRSWIGTGTLLMTGIGVLWAALVFGVGRGFDAWQSLPDPPAEAFNDGGPLIGSLLIGWVPATLVVTVTWGLALVVTTAAARRRAARVTHREE